MAETTISELDTTKPDGPTEAVATLDNYIQALKTSIRASIGVEHEVGSGTDSSDGYHKFPRQSAAPANPVTGSIYFDTDQDAIMMYDGTAWQFAGQSFAAGTRMLFYNPTSPTGWTEVDSALDDHAIKVVSVASASGGSAYAGANSFDAVLKNSVTTDGESGHVHNMNFPSDAPSTTVGLDSPTGINSAPASGGHTHTVNGATGGSTAPHSHTKTFDIKYTNVILCSKDAV